MTTMKTKEDLHWDDESSVNRGYDIKTSSLMHEEERKKNNFDRKAGLIKGRQKAYFDTKSIDSRTFMTKIGPIEQRETTSMGTTNLK